MATLSFYCGKMGAGKSTHAAQLAQDSHAILLSEDEWLAAHYPNEIQSLADYLTRAKRIKPVVQKLVLALLAHGNNVVLDFPANTAMQREWFKTLIEQSEAEHQLIYLEASNTLCLTRIAQRAIEQPERAATDTPAMFEQVNAYFEAPQQNEGFTIKHLHA